MNEIEAIFVKSFIAPEKRERWLTLLASSKSRNKILRRLSTLRGDFDPRFLFPREALPAQIATSVEKILAEWTRANPEQLCQIMGGAGGAGEMMPLTQAETDESLTMGAIVIVVPDRLAYYQTDRQPYKTSWFVLLR